MKELQLTYYGNPILRRKADPVETINEEIRELILAMEKKLKETKGVGIAAPQVGHALRIFLIAPPEELPDGAWQYGKIEAMINPILTNPSEDFLVENEGCLSIPGIYHDVDRPSSVHVRYQDIDGNWKERDAFGYEARIIMHENDHINGVLFIDRLSKKERKLIDPQLKKLKKKYTK